MHSDPEGPQEASNSRIVRPVLAFAILVVAACQSQSESASLDTENQKASYGIGLQTELGYGAQGTGANIGPNATLIFELELLEIVR